MFIAAIYLQYLSIWCTFLQFLLIYLSICSVHIIVSLCSSTYLQCLSFRLSIHLHHLNFYSVYLSTVCVYNVYIFTLCVYLLTDLKAEINHCACAVHILSAVTTHSICKAGSSPPSPHCHIQVHSISAYFCL